MNTQLRHGLFVVDEDGRILSEIEEIGVANENGIILTQKRRRSFEPHYKMTKVPKELWHKTKVVENTKESKTPKLWDIVPPKKEKTRVCCPNCGYKFPSTYYYKSLHSQKMMLGIECRKCQYKGKRPG